jgi:phospholipid-transporting ATPase
MQAITIIDNTIRRVKILDPHPPREFRDNKIKTSKYSLLTFLPKNLLEQFSKLANVYFLLISFMQMISIISISAGEPVMLMPLSFVIAVSMIKDIFEDYKRHKSDRLENYKQVLTYDTHSKVFVKREWHSLKTGMIVKVLCDEFFPADLVLLRSSETKGVCYVETKNLDGETNLKHKVSNKVLNQALQRLEDMENKVQGTLLCEEAND